MDAKMIFESQKFHRKPRSSKHYSPERRHRRKLVADKQKYDDIDEFPVRDSDLQIAREAKNDTTYNKNFNVFTALDYDQNSNKTNRHDQKSIELQTDESTFNSEQDLVELFVKNVLYKLATNSREKVELKQLVCNNREKCKIIVNKLFEAIVEQVSTGDSTSKEEEVNSYEYSNKFNTDSEAGTVNSIKNKVSSKQVFAYETMVQDIVNKCIENEKVSEITCTIKQGDGSKLRASTKDSSSTQRSLIRVRLSKNNSQGCKNRAVDCKNGAGESPNVEELKNIIADLKNDVTLGKTGSDNSNRSFRTKENSEIKTAETKIIKRFVKRAFSETYLLAAKEKKSALKDRLKPHISKDCSCCPQKPENKLRLDESENFGAKGLISQLCMFFCRRFTRN